MSTNTNNRAQTADTLNQLKQALASAKERLDTRSGKILIFAVQFLISFLNLFYLKGVIQTAYNSMFYRLDIPEENRTKFCISLCFTCLLFGFLMIITRKQIVTRLVIICAMPFYLPIFLFNYKYLVLIVPLGLFILITYLASGTPEGPKTILGALFLMFYIIGTFVFLTIQSILTPTVTDCVTKRDYSPEGHYRYSIVQEIDHANGNTYIAIEPNDADLSYKKLTWYAKGYSKEVYQVRPVRVLDVRWDTQTRAEITRELISNNPNTAFELNAAQMKALGLDVGYEETFTIGSLSRRVRHKLGYGSEKDSIDRRLAKLLRVTLVPKDTEITLTFDEMVELGLNPSVNQRLSTMTDEALEVLGVPEISEVLIADDKIVFREYVAILERSFMQASRSMAACLEPNELPEVHPEGVEIPVQTTETTTETTAETTTETTTTTTVIPQ